MQIALKEARESEYWLRVMIRSGIVTGENATGLIREAGEMKCILGAIIVSAKRNATADD
jgi:four helix bundle protein